MSTINEFVEETRTKFYNIGNAIRKVNGTTTEYTVDEMPIAIEQLSASGGSSIEGGYTVNFYNENNTLIGSYSTLCGYQIDKPISYTVKSWIDSDGNACIFPFTSDVAGSILDLYAYTDTTCVDELYSAYGVDINEYPYVFAIISDDDDVVLAFTKEYSKSTGMVGNMLVYNNCLYCYQAWSDTSGKDLSSAQDITSLFISSNLSISSYDSQSTYVQTRNINAVASNVTDIADYCTGFVNLNAPYNLN